jgi:hypothetical protein
MSCLKRCAITMCRHHGSHTFNQVITASSSAQGTHLLMCGGLSYDMQQPVQQLCGHQHLTRHLTLGSASRQAGQHTQA